MYLEFALGFNMYRIQSNAEYEIINTNSIPLYSQSISEDSEGSFYEDAFSFSVSPESAIIPALKKAFPENQNFLARIDSVFKNDSELGEFNKQLNKFMLIYFYEESSK